ncbi:hypothetical protein C8R43DRAFT_1201301 [Mycena crocata]|nr:hypothetical protein C8R43DRAFT_1201301 [Mycena crocata]
MQTESAAAVPRFPPYLTLLVITLDITQWQNNKKVLAVKIQIQDLMTVLFQLCHMRDPEEKGPDGTTLKEDRMGPLMPSIADNITNFLAKTIKSKIYEGRLAGYVADPNPPPDAQPEDYRWALAHINVAHLQPILEAIDDDGTGFVSIRKANDFAMSRPAGWSLLSWVTLWARGWHATPANVRAAEMYLAGGAIRRVELLLRSTRSAPGKTYDDPRLTRIADASPTCAHPVKPSSIQVDAGQIPFQPRLGKLCGLSAQLVAVCVPLAPPWIIPGYSLLGYPINDLRGRTTYLSKTAFRASICVGVSFVVQQRAHLVGIACQTSLAPSSPSTPKFSSAPATVNQAYVDGDRAAALRTVLKLLCIEPHVKQDAPASAALTLSGGVPVGRAGRGRGKSEHVNETPRCFGLLQVLVLSICLAFEQRSQQLCVVGQQRATVVFVFALAARQFHRSPEQLDLGSLELDSLVDGPFLVVVLAPAPPAVRSTRAPHPQLLGFLCSPLQLCLALDSQLYLLIPRCHHLRRTSPLRNPFELVIMAHGPVPAHCLRLLAGAVVWSRSSSPRVAATRFLEVFALAAHFTDALAG